MLSALKLLKRLTNLAFLPPAPCDRDLGRWWVFVQWGFLLLPLFPVFGIVGLSLGLLGITGQRWHEFGKSWLNRGLLVVALLFLLSTALAERKVDAALGLFNFLPFFWFCAALSELIQTPLQLRRLSWILVLTSIPVMLIGLAQQRLNLGGVINWGVVHWVIPAGGSPLGRMSSVFFYANVLASYFCITLVMSLGLWVEALGWMRQGSRQLSHPMGNSEGALAPGQDLQNQLPWLHRIGLGVIVLGNTLSLVMTDSRNAWGIALFVFLIFALYVGWHWLLAGVMAVGTVCFGAAYAPNRLSQPLRQVVPAFIWMRLNDQLYPNRPVADLRVTQWRFALDLIQQRPVWGWGLRSFTQIYRDRMGVYIGHPHNLPLMLASEAGVPAMVLLLGLVIGLVVQAVGLLHRWHGDLAQTMPGVRENRLIIFTWLVAIAAYALFHLFDVTLFDVRINLLGWLLIAAIAGVVTRQNCNAGTLRRNEAG